MPKILYHFPSRERPDKLIAAIENIISMARHDNYVILVSMDVDDSTCANVEFSKRLLAYDTVIPVYGFSKNKIDAVNRDIWMVGDADIIATHSDDMWFIKEGFDLDILEAFENFSGLVHFPDQKVGSALCTYPIMSKDYYKEDGWIYHPIFCNVYADNFQHLLAKHRNAYKFVDKQILEHRHHLWGYGEADALLKRTEEPNGYAEDRKRYNQLVKEYGI